MAAKNATIASLCGIAVLLSCTSCSTHDPNWRAPVETREPITNKHSSEPEPVRTVINLNPISPAAKHYQVQPDDTLFSIAWRSNNSLDQLARWNKLDAPYLIRPGQNLRLDAPPSRSARPKPEPVSKPSTKPTKAKPAPALPPKPIAQPSPPPKPEPTRPATKPGKLEWRWPLEGKLASTYKAGDPLRKGIKIAGKYGTPIKAAEGGRVVYSGRGLIGYGLLIIIKHNDQYLSAYGHNRKLLVKQGQEIRKGAKIAELGVTNAGIAQLHFEIRRGGKPVNPISLLPRH